MFRLIALSLVLSGCSGPLIKLPMPEVTNRAEILIYKDARLNMGSAPITFGVDNRAYLYIRGGQTASIYITLGKYRLFIGLGDVELESVEVSLQADDRSCLRIYPYPEGAIALIVPV